MPSMLLYSMHARMGEGEGEKSLPPFPLLDCSIEWHCSFSCFYSIYDMSGVLNFCHG